MRKDSRMGRCGAIVLLALFSLVLASCGGGGGGAPPGTGSPPVFTSTASISVAENTTVTGYTAMANDADGDTVTFSLSGGADQTAFSIDTSSGILSFNTAPDFEVPADSDSNNSYVVQITASDSINTVAQTVTVTVTNVNDASPVFTSTISISVAENTVVTGYTAMANDADGDTVTFSLSGGADQAAFSVDTSSGILSFNTAPDFEVPADSDSNNSYVVQVTASDGTNQVTQTVTVIVTDVINEGGLGSVTTLNLGVDIKTFRFTWTDVAGASFYRLLENPDGGSGFTRVGGDIPQGTQTVDHLVGLYQRLNASYILQSCNSAGCMDSSPLAVSGTLVAAIGYFKASNTGADDYFGQTVSLSSDGNTLAVGARAEDSNATGVGGDGADNTVSNAGAVYVFTRSGGIWSQQAYVKASNTGADLFGNVVSLSGDGNTLAVGAILESSNATGVGGDELDNSASGSGAVYVFTRSGGVWSQQAYVKASNTGAGDLFGQTLGLSGDGNTLAVGAYGEDSNATGVGGNGADNSVSNAGAVYVFTRSGGAWSQRAYVKASNTEVNDQFGIALALSTDGNTLAVGADGEDSNATGVGGNGADNTAPKAGAAYVFTRSGGVWSQQAYVKASNTGDSDLFGQTLSLSGDGSTLAVGAFGEASNATGVGGTQLDDTAVLAGAVYVFTRSGATWAQQAYVKASNAEGSDRFGWTVSLSGDGNTLAVGAHIEDSNATGIGGNQANGRANFAGAVYVFSHSGGTWSQQAYVKASNTENLDHFGWTVSLSGDGSTLAVGALEEDSNATGIGGNQADNTASSAGAVYVY